MSDGLNHITLLNVLFIFGTLLVSILTLWLGYNLFVKAFRPKIERYTQKEGSNLSFKTLAPAFIFSLFGMGLASVSVYEGMKFISSADTFSPPVDTVVTMGVVQSDSAKNFNRAFLDSNRRDFKTDSIINKEPAKIIASKDIPVFSPAKEEEPKEEIKPVTPAKPTVNSSFISYTVKRLMMPNPNLKDIFYIRNGTVALNVVVDNNGKIASQELNNSKSTTDDSALISYARRLVPQVTFTGATKKDSGTIYFKFGNNP